LSIADLPTKNRPRFCERFPEIIRTRNEGGGYAPEAFLRLGILRPEAKDPDYNPPGFSQRTPQSIEVPPDIEV
jgi:hypothetical protein